MVRICLPPEAANTTVGANGEDARPPPHLHWANETESSASADVDVASACLHSSLMFSLVGGGGGNDDGAGGAIADAATDDDDAETVWRVRTAD